MSESVLAAGKAEISVTHQSTLVSLAPEPESRLARAWALGGDRTPVAQNVISRKQAKRTESIQYVLLGINLS